MQIVTLITANILLLLILLAGVCIERRVTRLELTRGKEAARIRELKRELERIQLRFTGTEEADLTDIEAQRAKDAERRFTEGVASILSYGLRAAGKEREYVENSGA